MALFSNYNNVAKNDSRKEILKLAEIGIKSVMPKSVMKSKVKYSNGNLYIEDNLYQINSKRVFIIGAGKASAKMALELEKIIGPDNITDGIIISNIKGIKCVSGL